MHVVFFSCGCFVIKYDQKLSLLIRNFLSATAIGITVVIFAFTSSAFVLTGNFFVSMCPISCEQSRKLSLSIIIIAMFRNHNNCITTIIKNAFTAKKLETIELKLKHHTHCVIAEKKLKVTKCHIELYEYRRI